MGIQAGVPQIQRATQYTNVHALAAGANVINHNLGLVVPEAFVLRLQDTATGAPVSARVTATAANSITLTVAAALAGVRVTVLASLS